MDKIEYLQTQIDKIKIELVMKDYNNGWLNREYKNQLRKLEEELYKEITKSNGDSNILNS